MTTLTTTSLAEALRHLPPAADEPNVECQFIDLALLSALGFSHGEFCKQFRTGRGSQKVDYAIRKTEGEDRFSHTQDRPYLLIEAKGRNINLQETSTAYKETVTQLKDYMRASKCCSTIQWGIITNANHIQLFRKHGKVIHPATRCIELTPENIEQVVAEIRQQIENPVRALTVAVYANKGGVGKTSTTVNLAAVLGHAEQKKVLVIDFDPNQRDLTTTVAMNPSQDGLFKLLTERDTDLRSAIQPHTITHKGKTHHFFDVLPADQTLVQADDSLLRKFLRIDQLKTKLETVKSEYDYILIDCSPNWTLFSQLAMVASDVILTPAGFNDFNAINNVADTVKNYMPVIHKFRGDACPMQLPIFFSKGKLTANSKVTMNQAIDELIAKAKSEGFDLLEIFYSKFENGKEDRYIFEIPNYTNIAGSVFKGIPASYQYKTINDSYRSLAKEYFLP
jgi:cellulose biosynthesis protein BcsQ